jgi:prepilin-type N-terminal cleavage/methylation domain-containing protein
MRPRRAFTLVELLVVIMIVLLVSAVTLPTVIPALTNRHISESARILQAALAGARDSAIRYNAPRGIRLLPDALLSGTNVAANGALQQGQQLTASRFVPIEPAPDLTDSSQTGSATFVDRTAMAWTNAGGIAPAWPIAYGGTSGVYPLNPAIGVNAVLIVAQAEFVDNAVPTRLMPNPPTNWFWNVRIGDRLRVNDSGRFYTVVGPMTTFNPELFVNDGTPGTTPTLAIAYGPGSTPIVRNPEYLFLVNGLDDDANGYVDDGFDGVDKNANQVADDIAEWSEPETWVGAQSLAEVAAQGTFLTLKPAPPFKWTIARRPVPSPGAREVSLSAGATIDLTTWEPGVTHERSRLPVDPFSGTVDVLVNQAGQVIPTTVYSTAASYQMNGSFYHFWISDRGDVTTPVGTVYPALPQIPSLKKDRVLLTLFAKTGAIVTNSLESFDPKNPLDSNAPYADAQLGTRESK